MADEVTVSRSEYENLLKDAQFLAALRAAGVDNWEGYSEAYGIIQEWEAEKSDKRRD